MLKGHLEKVEKSAIAIEEEVIVENKMKRVVYEDGEGGEMYTRKNYNGE